MVMNKNDLKKYSVIVGDGSGCLFQPMTNEYTYILTAKHIFFEEKIKGRPKVQLPDGTNIEIKQCVEIEESWKEEAIEFTLIEGETYFPHKVADIAILKISPAIKGFDRIGISNQTEIIEETFLCGYPDNYRNEGKGDRFTNFKIERNIATGNNIVNAQIDVALNQNNIAGTSGGGILYINKNSINIMGIQSKMANSSNYQAGQVAFVPISLFNDIIEYSEYSGKLSKLYPLYMKKFDFLLDECFTIEVDEVDKQIGENIITTLRNKAYEITESDITPIGIKTLFKKRLLINENESFCLSHKKIWLSWLEFLVIFNIVKDYDITKEDLSDIFDSYRLKYANIDDWTSIFRKELLESDYIGLKENSTIIVSTRGKPKTRRNLYIPKGKMVDIVNVPDRRGFKVDKGIKPHTSFNYIHLDYFKDKCIIDKLDKYKNLIELEIIEKFKGEFNELFN